MNHFAIARMNLRSWRCKTLTAFAGISCAIFAAGTAHGQIFAEAAPVTVSLTPAAYFPAMSEGSTHTTIATDFDGKAPTSPWQISLLHLGRSVGSGGETYQVRMTNISSKTLSLPVGTDGQAIWESCKKSQISEVNIALRVSGQIAPAANLPTPHSCAEVSSSSLTVAPGASVIFAGALPGIVLAPEGATISAVASVCSASYTVDGSEPVATRQCQVPVVSNAALTNTPLSPTRGPVRVISPIAGVK